MESKEFTKTVSGKNNGFLHLFINLIMLVAFVLIIIKLAGLDCMLQDGNPDTPTGWIALPIILGVVFFITWIFHLCGFATVQPNESRVLTFFGKYSGTLK